MITHDDDSHGGNDHVILSQKDQHTVGTSMSHRLFSADLVGCV